MFCIMSWENDVSSGLGCNWKVWWPYPEDVDPRQVSQKSNLWMQALFSLRCEFFIVYSCALDIDNLSAYALHLGSRLGIS